MAKSITLMQTGQRGSSENMAKLRRRIQYVISSEHAISEPLTAYGSLWPANRKIVFNQAHACTQLFARCKNFGKNFFNCMIASMSHISACFVRFAVKLCKVRWSGDYLSPSDRPSVHCSQLFNDSGS
ncbi:Deoxyribonuclease-2-alpha [Trichinella pseudospiralis]